MRNRVILLARDDEQRPTGGILAIDLCFSPRVQVCCRCLEERCTRSGNRKGLKEFLRFFLTDGVREGVSKLVEGEWNGPVSVAGVLENGLC